jgi:hypothetical protein
MMLWQLQQFQAYQARGGGVAVPHLYEVNGILVDSGGRDNFISWLTF